MLPNNIKSSTHKLFHHLHSSIYSIQHSITIFHSYPLHSHHTSRSYSILQKSKSPTQPESTTASSTPSTETTTTTNTSTQQTTTGNEQHIEVHAFRSLITISPLRLDSSHHQYKPLKFLEILCYIQRARQD